LVVIAWLVFSWSLQVDDDPQALLRDMRVANRGNWQKAHALAALLRNPRHDAIRRNAELCRELSSVLHEQLLAAGTDPAEIEFRVFLCRALGEFRVPDGLPALVQAAEISQSKGGSEVQCAALEALAVLVGNLGPQIVRSEPRAMAALLDASRGPSDTESTAHRDRVVSTAAFTLGVVGGPDAVHRLQQLLNDPRTAVRYNAATGLARHGESAAIPVLLEMLDHDRLLSVSEVTDAAALAREHELVVANAIRAVRLVGAREDADRHVLIEALQELRDSPELPARLRTAAQAAQLELHARDELLK
jgi:hypothetical protein